jgi:hypothetical protein
MFKMLLNKLGERSDLQRQRERERLTYNPNLADEHFTGSSSHFLVASKGVGSLGCQIPTKSRVEIRLDERRRTPSKLTITVAVLPYIEKKKTKKKKTKIPF